MDLLDIKREMKDIRRKLHQIPETGFNEVETSQFVKDILTKYGYTYEEVIGTGVIAVKKGKVKEAIAFRADMDALMVEEKTEVPFKSTHNGRMHACGHDGHMSLLLGFAMYLSQIENLEKTVVLIFQPAEEGPGGAKVLVEKGYLKKYHVEAIFGFHLYPNIVEGKIGLVDGPMMAQSGEVDINIYATSSHGAMPHQGVDGIVVAANLISAYQSIISRNIEPIQGAVVTLGKITGGEARNIICGKVRLEGTIRAFNTEVYNTIKQRMGQINLGLEAMYGVKIELEVRDFYPPVVNDSQLFDMINSSINETDIEYMKPVMLAEDFSYYQEAVPGVFMFLGTRNEALGYIHPLHSCYFNFNEDVLIKGVENYIKICKKLNIF
ncbi:MAG: amidohydrolase [Haloplasmataceae bacterium]|nr:amidohydrolase [Haloplasmataceae bacterium]